MIDLDTAVIFLAASALLALAPGPDNIFVLAQSIVNGKAAGMKIILGLCTGLVVHTALVALGLSAVFRTSVTAFNALKYCGAAYLLFLSYKAFSASSSTIDTSERVRMTSWQFYRRGIIMNITNPKVSIFFMAFLPQFTRPANGPIALQFVLLGMMFIIVTFAVFGAISLLAGTIGGWIVKSEKGEKWLNRIAGTVFISLAVKLVLTDR